MPGLAIPNRTLRSALRPGSPEPQRVQLPALRPPSASTLSSTLSSRSSERLGRDLGRTKSRSPEPRAKSRSPEPRTKSRSPEPRDKSRSPHASPEPRGKRMREEQSFLRCVCDQDAAALELLLRRTPMLCADDRGVLGTSILYAAANLDIATFKVLFRYGA